MSLCTQDYVLHIKYACLKFWLLLLKRYWSVQSCLHPLLFVCVCVCVWLAAAFLMFRIKSPNGSLLCWAALSKLGLDKIWWCGSVSHGLAYIFIFLSFNKLFRVAVVAGKGCSLAWTVLEFFLILLVVFGAAWMRFSSV